MYFGTKKGERDKKGRRVINISHVLLKIKGAAWVLSCMYGLLWLWMIWTCSWMMKCKEKKRSKQLLKRAGDASVTYIHFGYICTFVKKGNYKARFPKWGTKCLWKGWGANNRRFCFSYWLKPRMLFLHARVEKAAAEFWISAWIPLAEQQKCGDSQSRTASCSAEQTAPFSH